MDKKKAPDEVNDQSDSPLDRGGVPKTDDTGWPEGPDGVRRPRLTQDERKSPDQMVNEEQAALQAAGELPEPAEAVQPEDLNAEEEDRKTKKKK